jgi:predicted membrane chloride channel (bestrophin family)
MARWELVAEEMEDPFDGDTNDLPIVKMAYSVKIQEEEIGSWVSIRSFPAFYKKLFHIIKIFSLNKQTIMLHPTDYF